MHEKGIEKVFETYTFTYDSDSLKEIFESVCPDSILFMGAYDTNFNWNESEREWQSLYSCYHEYFTFVFG